MTKAKKTRSKAAKSEKGSNTPAKSKKPGKSQEKGKKKDAKPKATKKKPLAAPDIKTTRRGAKGKKRARKSRTKSGNFPPFTQMNMDKHKGNKVPDHVQKHIDSSNFF